jgi:hemerythrin superfamily protein
MFGDMTSHPAGEHMVEELLWVHSVLRRDLNTVRRIASEVASGGRAGTAIRTLQTRSPLWQLRINCLTYCRFVHGHHGAEDVMLFPRLRSSNPALGPTVDRLEADHKMVSGLLDRVEELSSHLETAADQHEGTRRELVAALEELATTLLAHLDLEEKSITPTMRTWTRGLW